MKYYIFFFLFLSLPLSANLIGNNEQEFIENYCTQFDKDFINYLDKLLDLLNCGRLADDESFYERAYFLTHDIKNQYLFLIREYHDM